MRPYAQGKAMNKPQDKPKKVNISKLGRWSIRHVFLKDHPAAAEEAILIIESEWALNAFSALRRSQWDDFLSALPLAYRARLIKAVADKLMPLLPELVSKNLSPFLLSADDLEKKLA
jgi:hypothetical protein